TLSLHNTQAGDAGMAHLEDCKNLTRLYLGSTQVSDAGVAHFKDCKRLTDLYLESTKVGDAGLAHFKDCKNLMLLGLGNTQVSDARPGMPLLPTIELENVASSDWRLSAGSRRPPRVPCPEGAPLTAHLAPHVKGPQRCAYLVAPGHVEVRELPLARPGPGQVL